MKRKLIVSILITSLMMTLVVGCGGNGTLEPSDTTSAQITDEPTEPGEGVDIWAPFETTVTITTVTNEGDPNAYPEGDDITSNAWTREYKDRFNIELITDWTSSEYETRLNLSIVEGSLPDVFRVNASQLQQLYEADMLMDITDVFETYASDTIKSYMQLDLSSFESGHKDGMLFGIPQMGWGAITHPNYVWIRKDWRENLNLGEPETMDELVDMMRAFMDEYGGYGIAAERSMEYLNMLAVAWGANPGAWIRGNNEQIVYGSIQPQMKDALATWAAWYQEGLLSVDFATMDTAKMQQDVVDGKTGIQPAYQWWGWVPGIDVLKNNGENSYFEPFHIPSATGDEVLHTLFFDTTSYTVISKNCEHPEAALKMINLFSWIVEEDTRGEQDTDWVRKFTDSGMIHTVGAFRVLNPYGDYDQFQRVREAVRNNDPSVLTTMDVTKYDQVTLFMETGDPNQLGGYLQMGPERSSYALAQEILDNERFIRSELQGIMPQTLLDSGSTLNDILIEGFTKIIIGDQPIDSFETVVDNWTRAGGGQATVEMNEIYN